MRVSLDFHFGMIVASLILAVFARQGKNNTRFVAAAMILGVLLFIGAFIALNKGPAILAILTD